MSELRRKVSAAEFQDRVRNLVDTHPDLKAMIPDRAVAEPLRDETLPLALIVEGVLSGYADRPALGERAYDLVKKPGSEDTVRIYRQEFSMVTYGELLRRARAIAMAWRADPELKIEAGSFVSQVGFVGIDYWVLDMACILSHMVSVPLQSQTTASDFENIFQRTNPSVLSATTADIVDMTSQAIQHGNIPFLVVFDYDEGVSEDCRARDEAQELIIKSRADIQLISIQELVEAGSDLEWEPLSPHPAGDKRMALILHSSGSTGAPKGAIFDERTVRRTSWWPSIADYPTATIGFAPFNHGMGRAAPQRALTSGGTACFTLRPDLTTLFEDIRICRPTTAAFFPRVMDLVYQYYRNEVARRVAEGKGEEAEIEEQVKVEMRHTYLGDRLRGATFGSAPTTQKVRNFMADCFDIYLSEGYANTESGTGGLVRDNKVQQPPVTDYRLRDVPELGYFTTDKPYPRGEFCFKTDYMVKEYYKDPEATAKLLDEDGFSCTGDIVEERGAGNIFLIDRRKDVIKLAQGEYVAVGPLGSTFEHGSNAIHQSYIYGNALRAYLVAVIVPEMEAVRIALGKTPTDEELKVYLREQLQNVARTEGLKSFEVPREFIVEHTPFSQENGLLTTSSKRMRPALQRKYGEHLEALYEEIEARQEESLAALKDPECNLSTHEKIAKILEAELGRQNIDPNSKENFGQLGGDSLGAVGVALSIEDTFGVNLPANELLSPTANIGVWANKIDLSLSSGDNQLGSLVHVHGSKQSTLNAFDITLDKFFEEELIKQAPALVIKSGEPSTVFLTGANGYLGRFVALQWMEKLSLSGGKLICLIRGRDDEEARERLCAIFEGLDSNLENKFKELAEDHLEVAAGDLSEKFLGLGEERFNEISLRTDRISHVGALVNHRLGYEHLFAPNVSGTAEIIRMAITGERKPIDFVSTQAVIRFMDNAAGNEENAPLRKSIEIIDRYAMGYGASKWSCEHLLARAHDAFGLPINILRGPMMLAHSSYVGQINLEDTFTRLLSSIVLTGEAPYSFYEVDDQGRRQKAHYEGIPGDVVAAAVIAPAALNHAELRAFNICNFHHSDGCSLDTFVDAIESAGYPVNHICDFDEWNKRIREKLRNLSDEQRQRSALNILGAFSQPSDPDLTGRSCWNFQELLPHMTTGHTLPHLDEKFIHKCLNDMRVHGYIPEPPETSTEAPRKEDNNNLETAK